MRKTMLVHMMNGLFIAGPFQPSCFLLQFFLRNESEAQFLSS